MAVGIIDSGSMERRINVAMIEMDGVVWRQWTNVSELDIPRYEMLNARMLNAQSHDRVMFSPAAWARRTRCFKHHFPVPVKVQD
jgi:hypothetical protein